MKFEGFAKIEAHDSRTGKVKDVRERCNLAFDSQRMNMIFGWNYSGGSYFSDYVQLRYKYLYLSEVGNISQSSSMSYYAYTSNSISPNDSWIGYTQIFKTYPTQSFGGQSTTRTLRSVGITDLWYTSNYNLNYLTACPVDPPITHDAYTTIYVHYYIRVSMDTKDTAYGWEPLTGTNYARTYWFGNGDESSPYPKYIAMPTEYKKHFYVMPNSVYQYTSNRRDIFNYNADKSNYLLKSSHTLGQGWTGPYGALVAYDNLGFMVGCINTPHKSRVFAHKSSVTDAIFYNSAENDVPESEGTVNIECSATTLKQPSVFRLYFDTQGDVTTASYKLLEYVQPRGNNYPYPSMIHMYVCTTGTDVNSLFKNIYVSENRNWYITNVYLGTGNRWLYVGYTGLARPIMINMKGQSPNFCITDCGYVFFSYNETTTVVNLLDANSIEQIPPVTQFANLSTLFPTKNITNILGICYDDTLDLLWVATNNGFAKADIEASGGPIWSFYDKDTVGFGAYMGSNACCTIYSPWNGRFRAERGVLTWTQGDSSNIVWHWTGDRDARSVNVGAHVANMFLDLDVKFTYDPQFADDNLGCIAVVRTDYNDTNGGSNGCANGAAYPTFIRIGNSSTGLVVTMASGTNIHRPQYNNNNSYRFGYNCAFENGQFWYASPAAYSTDYTGYKSRIDVIGATGQPFTEYSYGNLMVYGFQPYDNGEYWLANPSLNSSGRRGWSSLNRSLVKGVMTMPLHQFTDGVDEVSYLCTDVGPIIWGWDGTDWSTLCSNSKTTHFDTQKFPYNMTISFADGGQGDSFRQGDYYTFGVNPKGLYQDNLQTTTVNFCIPGWHANYVKTTIVVPNTNTYTIPETASAGFVNMVAWLGDSHLKAVFLDRPNAPIAVMTNSTPASDLQVQATYGGVFTFYAGHVGERVELHYVWQTKVVD